MKGYPRWFTPCLLWALAALLLTGLLLVPTMLEMRLDWDPGWRLGGAARLATASLHAALAFGCTLFLGALWSVHMRAGWGRRRHRTTGLTLALLALALIVTALGVYYLADETLASGIALLHTVLGLVACACLALHWAQARHPHGQRRRAT
ncbi:hypothetical protein [Caldimonas brevitalea]|uniref:DUF4405 domain-containing protein n=1 Tax=Caldimonas brevitalea TaxID=413882 RepID=A0A0G3BJK3_9BURK|nr:hypothetical protein [Caldimonas brevitalea]AKJ29634.1 hypothetical protein AAW51_2943 [Caldimonas brevitalea]